MSIELGVSLLTALVSFVLSLFVYLKNPKSATNVYFSLLIFFLGLYPIFNYLTLASATSAEALFRSKFILLSAIPAGPLFYLFVKAFPGSKFFVTPRLPYVLILWTGLNLTLGFLGLIFASVSILDGRPEIVPGPAIPSFGLLQISSLVAGGVVLIKKYRHSTGRLKSQLRYITYGISISFALMLLATLILPLALHNTSLLSISPVFLLIAGTTIAYSIVRHRLLDIRAVVARSVAYVFLLATLGALYGASVFALSAVFFSGSSTSFAERLTNIAVAIILAFTFQPLRRFFERITDRVFYRDRYDSQEVLNRISKILAFELHLERLLHNSLRQVCMDLNVEMGQFMIYENNKIYRVSHFGPAPKKLLSAKETQVLRQSMLVADELEGGERKEVLDAHGIRVSVMLRTKEDFVGFLFLGDKLSGDIYSSQDLQLLEILASELSVAIENAKAYEEIAQFNITLQQKVKEATAHLRTANRNLKALDKAKDEFISMASHQLRTPLTTIKGYLSMVMEGDAGKVKPEQEQFLHYAFDGAERMVSLISDLLNVSRLNAGRFIIEKQPVDLVSVVSDEVRQLQTHAEAKNLELVFAPPKSKLPLVDLDEGKTRQVIMNFIDNAIYYTKTGGVYVSLERANDAVQFKVRDTGIGVPPAAQAKLFTKFFRAENAQVARPDGTGLGLYLAKRVVEDQGGTIIFETVEGAGSTFGFEMPIKSKRK